MAQGALQRWLLVNYAGYPFAPNSLMPDNGLANLAGALIEAGAHVRVLDYCTVATLRRMSSPELTTRLSRAWRESRTPRRGIMSPFRNLALLGALQRAERERQRLRLQAEAAIGDEIVETIRRDRIEAVGLKLWNGDGIEGSGRIAERIRRECPGVRLFGGGPHVDLFLGRILTAFPAFDALTCGEGEDTIRELAACGADPRAYASVHNLIYKDANGAIRHTPERMVENLDALPLPCYDPAAYPAMQADEKVKVIVIDESRGCRNNCAFCAHPVKSHQNVRVKSIPRLLKEVRELGARYGFRAFRFAGSCTPYALLNDFADAVCAERLTLRYASFAHIRDSNEADFPRIRESGCVALFFGIESGSQRILDAMRKGVSPRQILEALRGSHDAGIFTVGSLIYPAPGENEQSEAETLTLLKQAALDCVMLQAPVVIPRTDWFERSSDFGISINRERYLDESLTWKVKLQLPPRFWDPLPVRIDGRNYRRVLRATTAFSRKLSALGLPTAISDETHLMSVLARMPPVEFRNAAMAAFFAGDGDAVAELVSRINAGLSTIGPAASADAP